MILPIVTGLRLRKNAGQVRPAYAAALFPISDHISAGPQACMNRPRGMRYILATECSKPAATKADTGNRMASTLSLVVRAPSDSHSARQTRTLHKMPRNSAWPKGRVALSRANLRATCGDRAVPGEVLAG